MNKELLRMNAIVLFTVVEEVPKNVLGGELQSCCFEPKTGFIAMDLVKQVPKIMHIHDLCDNDLGVFGIHQIER